MWAVFFGFSKTKLLKAFVYALAEFSFKVSQFTQTSLLYKSLKYL